MHYSWNCWRVSVPLAMGGIVLLTRSSLPTSMVSRSAVRDFTLWADVSNQQFAFPFAIAPMLLADLLFSASVDPKASAADGFVHLTRAEQIGITRATQLAREAGLRE